MNDVLQALSRCRIIPVLSVKNEDLAVKAAGALEKGGLPACEITFRTPAAAGAIRRVREECPGVLVGAGTVLSVQQARDAAGAGAGFAVSPGLDPEVVKCCRDMGMTIIPGVATPTEIALAMSLGLDTVKLFPAKFLGGAAYIKALSGPYKGVRFMPTGGINAENVREYLALDCVLACGGSWMAGEKLVEAEKFDEVTRLAREAACIARRM